jgi:hypothetical protein
LYQSVFVVGLPLAIPRFRASPALVMGGAAALLLGVASAGLFGADKPVRVFSEDTEMKSVTGKLVQIAVAPPPKQVVAPADGKIATMPENLGDTPVFAPPTPTVTPPRRVAVAPRVETVEEVDVEPDDARAATRWRQIDSYDEAYVAPPPARVPRWRPADRYDDPPPRYEEPRYEERYAARDRRATDRRDYVERYYEPPPYRYAEPRYERGW